MRVHVEAHAGCPTEATFIQRVRARTLKARPALPKEHARTFTVMVAQDGPVSRGRLVIEELDGASSTRTVSGPSCDEVMSAMALVAALAIDPEQAYPAPPATSAPTGEPLPGAPPAIVSSRPAVYYAKPPDGWINARRPAPYVPPASSWETMALPLPVLVPPPDPSAVRRPYRIAVGAGGSAVSAAAPQLMPAVSLFVDAQLSPGELVSPSLRLSLTRAEGSTAGTGTARASFQLTHGRLDGCPVDVQLPAAIGATPCLIVEAGALNAGGEGLTASESHTRPWAAFGLLGRLHVELGDILRVEAQGGAILPLVRDTFYVEPDITVHEVPALGGFLGAGAGVCFW